MLVNTVVRATLLISILIVNLLLSPNGFAQDKGKSVIDAVVNIHLNKVRAWDDGYNTSTKGTGFVIDSQRGIILTNRHIIGVGPVVAYAEFSNKKIVELVPIYRDPVHDFGMFKYDPDKINGLKISPIQLSTNATVGESIRLYGNDGGEDLSIIEGVLSRIDRPAPDYRSTNTDFNTFYYQAALGSSGGSSGSPILNTQNQAIAINAGSRRDTETAFFLPMEMALPTIQKVLASDDVARGTLQTIFNFTPFNRFASLGINEKGLAHIGSPNLAGKLVVKHVIPEGAGDGVFQAGDLLLSIEDEQIDNFFQLETLLNARVGEKINLSLLRNNQKIQTSLPVEDLFSLTPQEYIEYGNSIAIPVGISMARLFNIPASGITLVDPGPFFGSRGIKRFALIEEIQNKPVESLDDFAEGLADISPGDKFSVRYRYPYDVNYQQYKQLTDYSNWFDNQRCRNEIGQRHWRCTPLAKRGESDKSPEFSPSQQVSSPVVDLEVFRPVLVNNLNDVIRLGQGAVVDKSAGLILTDKSVIDSSLAVIRVTFNNGVKAQGEVLAIHPFLNMALIKTDLNQVEFAPGVVPELHDTVIDKNSQFRFLSKSALLDFDIEATAGWPILQNNETYHDSFTFSLAPRFFGIYVNDQNQLAAVNTTYVYKKTRRNDIIPAPLIMDFLEATQQKKVGLFKIESTFDYISFADALELGLDPSEGVNAARFISVRNVEALGSGGLLPGDILLKINNIPVNSLNQLHRLVSGKQFVLDVLRNGKVTKIQSEAKLEEFETFENVVFWGGAVIHKMTDNVVFPEGPESGCLRIGIYFYGSPMHSSKTAGKRCIYQVDGVKIDSIRQLIGLLDDKKPGEYTRVKVIELNNNFRVAELRLQEDPFYWPIKHWQLNSDGWQRINH